MKSSPKVEVSPTNTASGKKLIQARLPFKSLGGASPVTSVVEPNQSESRKRKLTLTDDDGARAAKLNRKSGVKNVVDEDVPTIDLLATESMEASCDLNIVQKVNKENVFVEKKDGGDEVKVNGQRNGSEVDGEQSDEPISAEDSLSASSPKAKKCLDMGDGQPNGQRKSKRIKEEKEKIMIKLPMNKKQTAKKAKKADKSKLSEVTDDEEKGTDNDTSIVEPTASSSSLDKDDDTDEDTSILDISMSSAVDSPARVSLNDSIISLTKTPTLQKLTPKQLMKKADSEKKMLERQRAKEERERKIQEEKDLRQREKDEKERQRKKERDDKEALRRKERDDKENQKRLEKEEREKKRLAEIAKIEEQKKREREEKERKRQAELDAKTEDRKRKEEQREDERRKREELKEEERRKREDEKRSKDEAEQQKMRKTAQAFAKFFVAKKTDGKTDNEQGDRVEEQKTSNFVSFQVKENMKVAPTTRRTLASDERSTLEGNLFAGAPWNYLKELKMGKRDPFKSGKTWTVNDEEQTAADGDEVQILGMTRFYF